MAVLLAVILPGPAPQKENQQTVQITDPLHGVFLYHSYTSCLKMTQIPRNVKQHETLQKRHLYFFLFLAIDCKLIGGKNNNYDL